MTTTTSARSTPTLDPDQHIAMHGVSWTEYEVLLAIRGDRPSPRITYLEGELELMSPSRSHEWIKKTFARLIETWAVERRVPLVGLGSWTVKNARQRRGLEPDECYALSERHDRPDLAIEVVWTSPVIEKLDVYRGLGIPEVWIWEAGTIQVHVLRDGAYVQVTGGSNILPGAPLDAFARFVDYEDQLKAVYALIDWLRSSPGA